MNYELRPVTLADHLAEETLGERTPAQDPVAQMEQLLEETRFKRVMSMTALKFGKLTAVEKRNYTNWAKHFQRVMGEKASMFERNAGKEPELPAFLMKRG